MAFLAGYDVAAAFAVKADAVFDGGSFQLVFVHFCKPDGAFSSDLFFAEESIGTWYPCFDHVEHDPDTGSVISA
ncbi:hypothetical protein DV711_06250 [Motiliproteus coralliicola]|uniref:Uncharacterized protein n=1 Tax=Motiliproteus coralliicola TaxID=2283196 RepID=A0A369WX98_9GAMM|nr:hypothetical protein DV711_06250 [Motiliproteus coralliicola]